MHTMKKAFRQNAKTGTGIKKKTNLSDDKLMEALDIYWDEYKIFNKLK